ncbi:MAG: division/cell wall cluster transcriptional repressor MraZ [Dehalococcoidia bacterium]|nr:Transcriptional regulator MraZ [Chloroflexota bacterium]
MILGEYEYRIDQKGRVSIPAKLRKVFQDGLVLARGFDRCVLAYPLPEWQRICDRFADLPTTLDKNRRIIRFTFARAFSAELDRQGRVVLPSPLREYAGIKDVAVIAGGNKHLEIWSKELWEREKLLMDEQAWQIAEGMEWR